MNYKEKRTLVDEIMKTSDHFYLQRLLRASSIRRVGALQRVGAVDSSEFLHDREAGRMSNQVQY